MNETEGKVSIKKQIILVSYNSRDKATYWGKFATFSLISGGLWFIYTFASTIANEPHDFLVHPIEEILIAIFLILVLPAIILEQMTYGVDLLISESEIVVKSYCLVLGFPQGSERSIKKSDIRYFYIEKSDGKSRGSSTIYMIVFSGFGSEPERIQIPNFYVSKENIAGLIEDLSEIFRFDAQRSVPLDQVFG